jgi:GT2 family glycosyltransferase
MVGEGRYSALVPALSIVTATYNRADQLTRLLAAIDAQVGVDLEAIIVDDGSTDTTWTVLQEATRRFPWLRPMRLEHNSGRPAARNAGWQAASAPIVAFTDDDCVPDPAWAKSLLDALTDEEIDVVQGSTVPDWDAYWRRGPFDHTIRIERESPWFETCNLAMRRDLLAKLGGFDDVFRAACEDTDLGWRAKERGAITRYAPSALVTHDVVARSFRGQLRGERRRTSVVTVLRVHPGLREHLWRRVFFDPVHARLFASFCLVAAVAQKPTSPVRWVALSQTVASYGRKRIEWSIVKGPARMWPGWMAQLLVLDTVDMARLLRQSFREKTLVI